MIMVKRLKIQINKTTAIIAKNITTGQHIGHSLSFFISGILSKTLFIKWTDFKSNKSL